MGTQPIQEVDWGDFGVRKGNGPSYLLFRGKKVYELRTDIERDCRKLLRRLKISRKAAQNLIPLVWDLYSFGLPPNDPYERVIRQLQRIMKETPEPYENRIDELVSCLKAAWKLRRQFAPKEPVTQLCDWPLGLEVVLDGDGELNAILDCSDAQRGLKDALLRGTGPVEEVLDGKLTANLYSTTAFAQRNRLLPNSLKSLGVCLRKKR
jgi:hypothetical protein